MKGTRFSRLAPIIMAGWVQIGMAQAVTAITVELADGPHEGHYELAADESYCLYGTTNGDDWRTLYALEPGGAAPTGLSAVLLTLNSTSSAAGGTPEFFFSAGIGPYGGDDYVEYVLDPPNGNGEGSVTVAWDGRYHANLAVSGKTAEGIVVNASVTCSDVERVGGPPLTAADLAALEFGTVAGGGEPVGVLTLTVGTERFEVATGPGEAECVKGFSAEGDLFYGYHPKGATSVELYFPDFTAALAGTETFGLGFDTQAVYRPGQGGSGHARVSQAGNLLTIEVEVQAVDGTPVSATASCTLPN